MNSTSGTTVIMCASAFSECRASYAGAASCPTRKHGIVAARYAEKNPAALAAGTAEHLRPTDRYIDAVFMIEAVSRQDLADALPLVEGEALAVHGAEPQGEARRLSVIYTLHVPPRSAGGRT